MTVRESVIRAPLGLHARAAARFVRLATGFSSRVSVSCGGRTMDGKSIMGVLLLSAGAGASIEISADGADEAEAVASLCLLVASGCGEESWTV